MRSNPVASGYFEAIYADVRLQNTNIGWGSAWAFDNVGYFSKNDDAGIYRLRIGKDKNAETVVRLEIVSDDNAGNNNDGFYCPDSADPFPKPSIIHNFFER